ncbi:carboxylating nicotinate-nucleotide diphosphorylase [Timonella sp. A28]|uniref:carboxylating nicotinate-nucleotide diphosphorylase n=1 Tax=Timonella sp. A28 TaxID=3442640 RepID=UPI003EBC106F
MSSSHVVGNPMAPHVRSLDVEWVHDVVRRTLDEDLGGFPGRDVTSFSTMDPSVQATAHLMAREDGVVAGLAVVPEALAQVAARFNMGDTSVVFDVSDGARVRKGDRLAVLQGSVQAILIAERSLLNLASRASGVASATRAFADVLEGTGAMVLDTRKTTPGLRELDKYAVRAGGGTNKRMGLYDVAMVKDNHVVAAGSIAGAVTAVREKFPDVVIQVEADTYEQTLEAVAAGARFLLLDNMSCEDMTRVVDALRPQEAALGKIELEATGNITLDRAAAIAATGVDYMSVGALTHSAPIMDLALDLME